jgi:hypothetical protein
MLFKTVCTVEFIGGPLDGFVRTIAAREPCGEYVVVPVNVQLLKIADGQQLDSNAAITSVAIYRVEGIGTEYVYRFLKSISPHDC